jgi:hypothetical protein
MGEVEQLRELVPFFAEDPIGNGSFTLLMQHSEADLFLDGEGDGFNRNVDQANADTA